MGSLPLNQTWNQRLLLRTLVDVSDIFYFFSAQGREKGSPRHRDGRGDDFYWKSQEGSPGRAGGEGLGGCLRGIWGGGLNILFRAKIPTKEHRCPIASGFKSNPLAAIRLIEIPVANCTVQV